MGKPSKPVIDPAKMRDDDNTADAKRLVENMKRQGEKSRGHAENFIKLHKAQFASDRTSCRDPRANQVRLILHTAAYWLLHTLRAAAPKRSEWARAEFNTLRLRLIKIAARVVEGAARIRIWLPTACPDAAMFTRLANRFAAGP